MKIIPVGGTAIFGGSKDYEIIISAEADVGHEPFGEIAWIVGKIHAA